MAERAATLSQEREMVGSLFLFELGQKQVHGASEFGVIIFQVM